jgi:hypothetical protein
MPTDASTVLSISASVITLLGGSSVVVLGLSAFIGKIWATRISQRENAGLTADLETLKSKLSRLTDEHSDGLTRRRDVYSKLANGMRALIGAGNQRAEELKERQDLLMAAYDEACVWASEEVVSTLGTLLDAFTPNANRAGPAPETELRSAFRGCILAMRRDSGFPDSTFEYRFVSFDKGADATSKRHRA